MERHKCGAHNPCLTPDKQLVHHPNSSGEVGLNVEAVQESALSPLEAGCEGRRVADTHAGRRPGEKGGGFEPGARHELRSGPADGVEGGERRFDPRGITSGAA